VSGAPDYITPEGYRRLIDEQEHLLRVERPKIVEEVATAAAHGDRSENAEYIYGKRKLRQIDSRLQFLNHRLSKVEVVDPTQQKGKQARFGAVVTVEDEDGERRTYRIVGIDEVDAKAGKVSYQSPLGQALLQKREGDAVLVHRPAGELELTVVKVAYP
jgi:transcription elongation factor GreB